LDLLQGDPGEDGKVVSYLFIFIYLNPFLASQYGFHDGVDGHRVVLVYRDLLGPAVFRGRLEPRGPEERRYCNHQTD
jgi:hypothetical protein